MTIEQGSDLLGKGVVLNPVLVDLVDDLATGLMLSQLLYWSLPGKNGRPKLKIERDGRLWLARTQEEWWGACRLSERQCRRSLKTLEELGLIEVRMWLDGKIRTPHIWLDLERLECLLVGSSRNVTTIVTKRDHHSHETSGPLKKEIYRDLERVKNCAEGAEKNHVPEIEVRPGPVPVVFSEGQGEKREEGRRRTVEMMRSSGWTDQQIEQTLGENLPGDWWVMKANEILAKQKEKGLTAGVISQTRAALEMLWKKRMALLWTESYVKPFTGKERGQLGLLIQNCEGKSGHVVDWCMTNWHSFCSEVMHAKGISLTPDVPNIGFLLKYHDVAMQLIAKPDTPQQLSQTVTLPVQLIAKPAQAQDNHEKEEQAELLAQWLSSKGGG